MARAPRLRASLELAASFAGDADGEIFTRGRSLAASFIARGEAVTERAEGIAGPLGALGPDARDVLYLGAALARDPRALARAHRLANRLGRDAGPRAQAMFLTAILLAAGEREAVAAYGLAEQLGRGSSPEVRAAIMAAAALVGDEAAVVRAFDLAGKLDGRWSPESRAVYLIAAALANDEAAVRAAYHLAPQLEGGWINEDARALYTVAAVFAKGEQAMRDAAFAGAALDRRFSRRPRSDSRALYTLDALLQAPQRRSSRASRRRATVAALAAFALR